MSKKNTKEAKQARRVQRTETRLTPARQSQTQYHLVPLGDNGYRRIKGQCATCLLKYEVSLQSEGAIQLDLTHECLLEFFTESQFEAIQEAARLTVAKHAETPPNEEE